MTLVYSSKNKLTVFALLTIFLAKACTSEPIDCTTANYVEIKKYFYALLSILPFDIQEEQQLDLQCFEEDGRIVFLDYFLKFIYQDNDMLIYFSAEKNYDGELFQDGQDMTILVQFLDPKINTNIHTRILGRIPGLKGGVYTLDIKNGKFGKSKPYYKKKKGEKEEEPTEEDLENEKLQVLKDNVVVDSEQAFKDQILKEKKKVEKKPALTKGPSKLQRGSSKLLVPAAKMFDKHSIDLQDYIHQENLLKYFLTNLTRIILFNKLLNKQKTQTFFENLSFFGNDDENPEFVEYNKDSGRPLSSYDNIHWRFHQMEHEEKCNQPLGYKMHFEFKLEKFFSFHAPTGYGFMVKIREHTSHKERKLTENVIFYLPLEGEHIKNVQRTYDAKINEARGINYLVETDTQVFDFAYFLIFSNNMNSPNDNYNLRYSMTGIFESWFRFTQDIEKQFIPFSMDTISHLDNELGFDLKDIWLRYLTKSLYFPFIEFVSNDPEFKGEEAIHIQPGEFLDIKFQNEKGKWENIKSKSAEFPTMAFDLVRNSFFIKLEVNQEKIKQMKEGLEESNGVVFHLTDHSKKVMKDINLIINAIRCVVITDFEIKFPRKLVRYGMTDADYLLSLRSIETLKKVTLSRVSCKNITDPKKIKMPIQYMNQADAITMFMDHSFKPQLRVESTYAGLA